MAIMKSCSSPKSKTVVLVGRSGNGMSATANTILGRQQFKSRLSSLGVTKACEAASTIIDDGSTIKIIDTPGLSGSSKQPDFSLIEEIRKSTRIAEHGIDAFLLVLSTRFRFSVEDQYVVRHLETIFGSNFTDYLIIGFTGGDILNESKETIEDFLTATCPEFLMKLLHQCGHRMVVFDNKCGDKKKQVESLLTLVKSIGRDPFTGRADEFSEAVAAVGYEMESQCEFCSRLKVGKLTEPEDETFYFVDRSIDIEEGLLAETKLGPDNTVEDGKLIEPAMGDEPLRLKDANHKITSGAYGSQLKDGKLTDNSVEAKEKLDVYLKLNYLNEMEKVTDKSVEVQRHIDDAEITSGLKITSGAYGSQLKDGKITEPEVETFMAETKLGPAKCDAEAEEKHDVNDALRDPEKRMLEGIVAETKLGPATCDSLNDSGSDLKTNYTNEMVQETEHSEAETEVAPVQLNSRSPLGLKSALAMAAVVVVCFIYISRRA